MTPPAAPAPGTPARESHNARRAAKDAIAYIGAFNSGASAISLPILNEAGVPMISPSNTAVGLTRRGPGANPREPDKYYPTGVRTYFRLTPNDAVQGGAPAAAARAQRRGAQEHPPAAQLRDPGPLVERDRAARDEPVGAGDL